MVYDAKFRYAGAFKEDGRARFIGARIEGIAPVEIREATGAECPVAAVVRTPVGATVEYRRLVAGVAVRNELGVTQALDRIFCASYGRFTREDAPGIAVRKSAEDLENRAKALRHNSSVAERIAIVDGEVWTVGEDPVLEVRPDGDCARVFLSESSAMKPDAFRQFKLLTDPAALAAFAAEAYPDLRYDDALPAFEVLNPSALRSRPEVKGLRCLASLCVMDVPLERLWDARYRDMVSYARIKDILDWHPDPMGAPGDPHEVMRSAFEDFAERFPDAVAKHAIHAATVAAQGKATREADRTSEIDAEADEALAAFSP